jgi:hypothetical protein
MKSEQWCNCKRQLVVGQGRLGHWVIIKQLLRLNEPKVRHWSPDETSLRCQHELGLSADVRKLHKLNYVQLVK